jgi:uncharacterized protein YjbI with pentapeptide repeats
MGQLSAAREQVETTEWRDFLNSLEKHDQDILQDPTIPFRLRSFSSSPRYSKDAKLIAAIVMGKMANPEGFIQLFNFVFPNKGDIDINTMLEVARQQSTSFRVIEKSCMDRSSMFNFGKNQSNICWNGYTEKQVQEFGLKPEDKESTTLRKKYIALLSQLRFISSKIPEALREQRNRRININASDVKLYSADFSSVDFDQIDISDTYFDHITLKKAILRPSNYKSVYFWMSNWWDAEKVDPTLLKWLMTNMYPGAHGDIFPNLTRAKYVGAILQLCIRSGITCSSEAVKYEPNDRAQGDG